MSVISENLEQLLETIERTCLRYGRKREEVRLMGVSKRQPWENIVAAYDAGLRLFGENRVQETVTKWTRRWDDVELHLIGHLQRNKARDAARHYDAVESIDKVSTAEALHRRCEADGRERKLPVLLEVNTSGEESKSGVESFEELSALAEAVLTMNQLELRGLMTIGPLTAEKSRIRGAFASLRESRDLLAERVVGGSLPVLSMGMSGDFEEAIAEGSTLVRIGTALFGLREER